MELKDVLARNLRLLRQKKEITQEELADRTGLSSRYVGSIERARVSVSITVLGKLALAMDVDPCELIRNGTAAR
ncbi:transcriptional regulator, XRE family protein [Sphingomonas sp. SKA58]|uniref:helix-turn-helix domain-containing protein n=1 Tax=Sphingomonas sp. (strain SKA58) TaxID=314266 RepID=UPI0000D7A64D|nr:helix-turn-helix transcriptional regulator [Sphingomonas sp. SKA58]EAT08828.1 transcriptional regulator, XRE family protein [Sphingomonas sp. SKA58]